MTGRRLNFLDPIVFTSGWAAAVAALLCAAASSALGVSAHPSDIALAFSGTFFVYNVDRLRDTARDRATSPVRTAFIEAHRSGLLAVTALAGLVALALGFAAGTRAVWLCAVVVGLGLLHRRLKRRPGFKTAYVTLAWVAVVVGLPALRASAASGAVLWSALVLGFSIAANVVASDLRDAEQHGAEQGALSRAATLCALAAGLAFLGPSSGLTLGAIPLAVAASLVALPDEIRDGRGERYGMVVVDGALGLGALWAWALA